MVVADVVENLHNLPGPEVSSFARVVASQADENHVKSGLLDDALGTVGENNRGAHVDVILCKGTGTEKSKNRFRSKNVISDL